MTKLPFSQLTYFLTFLLFSIPFLVTSSFSPAETATLLHIKNEWKNPPLLQSWNDTSSTCDWSGIQCSSGGDSVTGLLLHNFNISGKVPDSISTLNNLRVLDLGYNYFHGNFPTAILKLSNLCYLDLSQNSFVGIIPASIALLKNLEYLDLSINYFTGSVPPAIGNLKHLRTLILVWNSFNGTYPNEISNLANLESLQLAYNNFTPAPIPLEFAKLNKLTYFWMSRANVIGELSDRLLENFPSLTVLDFSQNHLQGRIPNAVFLMENLTELYLWSNRFTGSIPQVVKSLDLVEISLSGNQLSGRIPKDFGKLKKLEVLEMFNNNLIGEIPPAFGSLVELGDLDLSFNQLSGIIPPTLGKLNFTSLNLSSNHLSGSIPCELDNEKFDRSFMNNPKLCSNNKMNNVTMCPPNFKNCKKNIINKL